jgi:hypothetical protein
VGVLLTCVAADLLAGDPAPRELVVEQDAGPGAALAVHVAQSGAREVVDPGQPQRVAGRDDQALVAVQESDHSDVSPSQHSIDVGQRVLPAGRVEQMRAGQVAEAVAEGDEPAKRPYVGGGQGDVGVGRPQARRGQIEDEVVRPDGDDGPLDLADSAQQGYLDFLAGMVAFQPGGDDEQAVRTHE